MKNKMNENKELEFQFNNHKVDVFHETISKANKQIKLIFFQQILKTIIVTGLFISTTYVAYNYLEKEVIILEVKAP